MFCMFSMLEQLGKVFKFDIDKLQQKIKIFKGSTTTTIDQWLDWLQQLNQINVFQIFTKC